jgi:hypothetical protein
MVTDIIETQEILDISTVDMRAIMNQIRNNVLQNCNFTYKLRYLGENIWTLRIRSPNANRPARIEIIIDEYANPEDRGARGAVFTYGDIPRNQVAIIMDSIMERI